MTAELGFTLSLSAVLQGLIVLGIGMIGFFIKREVARLDESRRQQIESNREIFALLRDLKEQHIKCLQLFASREDVSKIQATVIRHDRELGELHSSVELCVNGQAELERRLLQCRM